MMGSEAEVMTATCHQHNQMRTNVFAVHFLGERDHFYGKIYYNCEDFQEKEKDKENIFLALLLLLDCLLTPKKKSKVKLFYFLFLCLSI